MIRNHNWVTKTANSFASPISEQFSDQLYKDLLIAVTFFRTESVDVLVDSNFADDMSHGFLHVCKALHNMQHAAYIHVYRIMENTSLHTIPISNRNCFQFSHADIVL